MSREEELKTLIERRRAEVEKMRKNITQFVGETEELEDELTKLCKTWVPFRSLNLGDTFLYQEEKHIKVYFILGSNANAVCFDGCTRYMDGSTLVERIKNENKNIVALSNSETLDILNKLTLSVKKRKRYLSMLNLELEALESNCAVCDTYIFDFKEVIKIFELLPTEK